MGNCTKHSSKSIVQRRQQTGAVLDKYYQEPEDTASLANITLPTIDIRPLLRKVKIKNSPQKKVGARFLICGTDQVLLPEKNVDEYNCARWEIQQNFQYLLTEYQLRQKFLIVELMANGSVLATLKINMYLISVGPYHLDFQFPMNINSKPRISFDFKISQVVNMRIQTQTLEIYDMKEYVGQQYAFCLKTIFGNNPKISQLSSVYKVTHDPPQNSNIPIAVWNNTQNSLPSISGSVPFYQFHYATLKFTFFKIDKVNFQTVEKPVAQSFISFVKLLSFDSQSKIVKDNIEYQVKKISLQQKLWSNGKQCGRIKLNIKFDIQHHLKQMLVCVRSQTGIVKFSPVIQSNQNKNSKQINKQITELQLISDKLDNEQAELQKRRTKAKKTGQKIGSMTGVTKQSYKAIERCLESQLKILQKSTKQSIKIYQYSSQQDLLKGQIFLLKLGQKLIRYIDEGQQLLEDLKWKVLRSLIQRGQFKLINVGFDVNNQKNSDQGYLSRKKSYAFKYQEFHYKLLQLTLKTLGIKAANQQKKFAEYFSAVAYFRIPEFREKILYLIDKPNDPQIDEWRGTDFSLKSTNNDFKTYLVGQNTFQILFNWQKYFYDYIRNQPQYKRNLAQLQRIFQNKQWQTRISHRRGAFFAFIKQWVNYVKKISVRIVHSNWKHFPGYIQIIRSLMAEMKIRPVRQYPPSIKMAFNSLLSNENLLNTFVTIIFNKTSINNNVDVIKILDLTNGFLDSIKKQNKRIPSTFNYTFFYNGLKMVIENLYSYSTAKALHLIYQQFDFFIYEFRIQLCNYLLGRIFFKLFLHWSYNVRIMFIHVMTVKIYKFFSNQLKVQNIDPETRQAIRNISSRYSQLLIILENVKKIKSKMYVPTTQNELYKKLRNNLRKKKKIKNKQQNDTMSLQILTQIPDTNKNQYNPIKARQDGQKLMTSLAQPKLERYDSQIISKDIRIALSQTPIKPKDEIIRKKVTMANQQVENINVSTQQIQDPQVVRKKAQVSMNTAQQLQMPILSQEDMKYVGPAMLEYNITSNSYLESIKKKKGDPTLKMQIMLDSTEMKPQEYNDVQEW